MRAVVCPHCGYDFPPSSPAPAPAPSWDAIGFGSLWLVSGIIVAFFIPGRAADWCLVGFAITAGLASILSGVRPLLGPDAARIAGPAAVACAVIATGAAVTGLWLGERDFMLVVWLIFIGGAALLGGVPLLRRWIRRRA
jgi:hypothetical protein